MNALENSLKELQKKIDYFFSDPSLLKQALTHKSFANERKDDSIQDNERFEFLGDAVLELSITHILMERFKELSEGKLSKLRAAIVNKDSLSAIAKKFDLDTYILLGRGEEAGGGRTKRSILANVYEAIIAAVYYDGGFQRAFVIIEKHFSGLIQEVQEKGLSKDYKSRLQEYSQSIFGMPPEYVLTSAEGPDHEKVFKVEVLINGTSYETGTGRNKKAAEQEAARKTLKRLCREQI